MEVSSAVQQRISTALTQFKAQMRSSNKRYITNLLFLANSLPPHRRMSNFAESIKLDGTLPATFKTPEEVIANPPPAAKWKIEHDGTWPAKPEDVLREYLKSLEEKINNSFEQSGEVGETISVPEEYRALLQECDGVWDVDFRRSGCAGMQGTNCLSGGGTPFVGKDLPFRQVDTSEEQEYGWTIATGWCLDGNETVSHYYFYCRRTAEGRGGAVQKKETGWEWRLFYRDLDSDDDHAFRVFQNIPDFLGWFGDWYARDVEGDEGDDRDEEPRSPYEEGLDYENREGDEDDEYEERLAKEMQKFNIRETVRQVDD